MGDIKRASYTSSGSWIRRKLNHRETGVIVSLIAMIGVFSMLNPDFLGLANIATILRASAFTGVMAVGMTYLLISGMIDLSVGSMAGLAGVITSYAIVKQGAPIWLSVVLGIISGAVIGYINSRFVLRLKIPAFLATIGMMYVARGLAMYLSNGYAIYPLPAQIERFGTASPFGLSWHFLLFIVLTIFSEIVLRKTVWGLTVKATGSSREIAKMTEVNIDRVNTQTFMLGGIFAALAGLLLMSRIITGEPDAGTGWELNAITACAIGGVSLFGFEGSFFGMFLGVLAIQVIQNGLVVVGVSPYLQTVVVGLLLLAIVTIDLTKRQLETKGIDQ